MTKIFSLFKEPLFISHSKKDNKNDVYALSYLCIGSYIRPWLSTRYDNSSWKIQTLKLTEWLQNQFQNSIFQFASIMECFLRWLMKIWLKRKFLFLSWQTWQLLRGFFFFFRLKTMHKMMERSGTLFRDPEDVEQATRFLHENGKIFSLHKNCNHLHHVFFMG